jgi:hypothetical protein
MRHQCCLIIDLSLSITSSSAEAYEIALFPLLGRISHKYYIQQDGSLSPGFWAGRAPPARLSVSSCCHPAPPRLLCPAACRVALWLRSWL